MNSEYCQCCGARSSDRRTLWMSCLYDMSELSVPFTEQIFLISPAVAVDRVQTKKLFYTLRVCKECRANWMLAIQKWFKLKGVAP
jgi:hypothetical protein